MNDLKINNHNFKPTYNDSIQWYVCTKCNIETSFTLLEGSFTYYRSKDDMIGDENLNNLFCEEVIIKNIIE